MIYDGFQNWKDVEEKFNTTISDNVIPLLAVYDMDGYEGSAFVAFIDGPNLKMVYGAHCSCFGLENQFDPEVVEWEIAEAFFEKTWPYGINESHKAYLLSIIREVTRPGTSVKEEVRGMSVMHRLAN